MEDRFCIALDQHTQPRDHVWILEPIRNPQTAAVSGESETVCSVSHPDRTCWVCKSAQAIVSVPWNQGEERAQDPNKPITSVYAQG